MSLLWAFVLLALINFMFGVFLSEEIAEELQMDRGRKLHESSTADWMSQIGASPRNLHVFTDMTRATTTQELESRYGNLGRCMATLLYAVSGGDWGQLVRPIADLSTEATCLYALYVMLVIFGILNILTGTFVETAVQASSQDRDNAVDATLQQENSYLNKLRTVFEESDKDNSGQISFEEFESHLDNKEVAAYLDSMGLDATEARGIYQLLDVDNSKSIYIDELVAGCMRLKGQARAVDMATLVYENKRMMKRHILFAEYCHDQFSNLGAVTQSIAHSVAVLDKLVCRSAGVTAIQAKLDSHMQQQSASQFVRAGTPNQDGKPSARAERMHEQSMGSLHQSRI